MVRALLLLFLLLTNSLLVYSKLWMPVIFGDQMVLQQDTNVKIWGTAESDNPVVIKTSWDKQTYKVYPSKEGNWSCLLKTLPADFKSYQLTVKQGKEQLVFSDILFGEVWLCSGQSNMEMKMKGYYGKPIIGGQKAIADGKNEYLRFFEIAKKATHNEQLDCQGKWQNATHYNIANFSATAYFFGQQLQKTLQVPVALISASWGGASIVAYMSKDALDNFKEYSIPQKKEDIHSPIMTPTALFNGMIHPVIGYGMKGCIWYQGETDRKKPTLYKFLYKSMLSDWRSKWGIGAFPVYYAQIAPFDYKDGNSAFFREAQMQCQQENENTYMISLLDVGEKADIHPSEKETVGFRLTMAALDKTYKVEGIVSNGPIYKSMKVENEKAILSFEYAQNGLTTYGLYLDQFLIAGDNRIFYPATASIKKGEVIVYNQNVPKPIAVRYGFSDYVKGTLYNIEGCPASSFRTDNWEEKAGM